MTDFNQDMVQCPVCKEKKVFVIRNANVLSLYKFPFYPTGKQAIAHCRTCNKTVIYGADSIVDEQLDQSLASLVYPRKFYAGVIILPSLIVIGTILSLVW